MYLSEFEQTFLIFFNMSTFFIKIAMYLIKGPGYSGGYRTLKHNLNRHFYFKRLRKTWKLKLSERK
ncbi:hypothetical protein HNP21_004956 [Bacillus aryabhattai]|uniref:Uncharacterized protein n=1 Tax=Priestia aryabhattai TaxID=412384 RepID=A0A7W3NFB9_PRIAR|nr:hypothetical protein [Priestia aryabhattai]